MKELVTLQKCIMLDDDNFGHWKARMRHIIKLIEEETWIAVEHGCLLPPCLWKTRSLRQNQKRGGLTLIWQSQLDGLNNNLFSK